MRVIFINRFYWPDEPATAQLLTDLAEALAATGHDVTVITSHPRDPHVPRSEIRNNVRIERVRSSRARQPGLCGKAVDFATFHVGAMWRLFTLARRDDTVIAMTDPPLLGVGAWLVAAVRGARLYHWVQDIYPELAIELSGHRWLAIIKPLRNLAWRRAAGCTTLGADMAAVLAAAGVAKKNICIIPNWSPSGLAPPSPTATAALRTEWELEGKFVVAYSGNLGRVHDLDPILAVAEAVSADQRIAFVCIGSGAQRNVMESEVTRLGLTNIQFRPPQIRTQLATALGLADVHLVTLRPGCERYVFPSKLYGVAAVGRPVIFIGPRTSELARLVVARDFGRAFDRTMITAIAAEIRSLFDNPTECRQRSANALQFAREFGDATIAAARWETLLDSAEAC